MIIEAVRNFFLDCPLTEGRKINVDYLGVDAIEYTIDPIPTEKIIRPYADGGALKQFVFVFGSREYYGADTLQNIENSGFYQQFEEWLDQQSQEDNLPELSGKKESRKLEATTQGYLFGATEDKARYQIQCRLTYYEDK